MDKDFLIIATVIAALLAGYVIGRFHKPKPRFTLKIMLNLDATQPVQILAKGYDAEKNEISLADTDLTVSAEGTNDKNFGEVNDANDTFNPGEAGATGFISGSVTVDGVVYEAKTDEIELVAGGLTEIALDFAPVAEPVVDENPTEPGD